MSFFSKNLEYLRKTKDMSRSELAQKLNVNQSTISRWENEDMGVTVDNAYDVAQFFNVSIADLTGRDLSTGNYDNIKKQRYAILYDKIKELSEKDLDLIDSIVETRIKQIDKEQGEDVE